jgi:DNA-binding transcriptional ArsR family regulator
VIEFRLTAEAISAAHFGYSPLAELATSLRALGSPLQRDYLLRPWLREVAGSLRHVDMELLGGVAPPGHHAADFLFAWSRDSTVTIDDQLAVLADAPPDEIWRDIVNTWSGQPPARVARAFADAGSGCRELADALRSYWDVAIGPYWSRIRAVIDGDVAHRSSLALERGLLGVLQDLQPEVSLRGRSLLVDKPHHPDARYSEGDLILLPSVFVWPNLIVGHETPGRFELHYPARGVGRVWEGLRDAQEAGERPLGALLGRTRAWILARLDEPMTTTQLARELSQSPGSVNAHLSVMRDSGLLVAQRSGRLVLYRRTPLGATIVSSVERQGERNAALPESDERPA